MRFPPELVAVVEDAENNNPNDIAAAVDEAVAAVEGLPSYAELVDSLVRAAIQELVYDLRHKRSVSIRRNTKGGYGSPAKVVVGTSETVKKVYDTYYDYRIGGKTLGLLTKIDCLALADSETRIANGHYAKARLVKWLADTLPMDDRTVAQVVSLKVLGKKFKEFGLQTD